LSLVGAFSPVSNRAPISSSLHETATPTVTSDTITKTESPTTSTSNSSSQSTPKKEIAVLICPAQFCVPADYENLIQTLKEKNPLITTAKVAPLPRTEWIKFAQQLPTESFLTANLSNAKTLKWYYDAIETSLAEIYSETASSSTPTDVCIIAHSIGGWVARGFLGGLSQSSTAVYKSATDRVTSLVTLGSPHFSPETALVDQTRGLLREVESTYACSSQGLEDNGIKVTCVGSKAVKSNVFTTDIEEIVATTSYLPLIEKWSSIASSDTPIVGDGIIPTELAFMESPANKIEIESCSITGNPVRHAHVLPTPWNLWDGYAPSIELGEEFTWYGSDGVIDQWIDGIN